VTMAEKMGVKEKTKRVVDNSDNTLALMHKIVYGTLKYLSLIFFSFVALLPLVSVLITALKNNEEYETTNVMALPKVWNFQNFADAFTTANMGQAFLNSGVILLFVLVLSTFMGTQVAYVLSRFKFRGNGLIHNLFLFATFLPGIAMQVSVYDIMTKLHLINHLYGYIIMQCGTDVISIYVYLQYFENIPIELDESGIMDGANYFQIYKSILLPLLKPAIVTACILKGVGTYNEYYCANLYLQDKTKLATVATSLYTFVGPLGSQYNMICAGVIISLLPALLIFLLCQKQIYSGLTAGAVKG